MKRMRLAFLGLVAAAAWAVPGAAQIGHAPADSTAQDPIERQCLEAMRLIYQGRGDEAGHVIDAMLRSAPDDPRPHFMRARLMRERVSEQNASRSSIKPQVKAIHTVLDRCVQASEKILDRDPHSRLGILYRGWGRMFKSQLHALTFEHWSAGQQAKTGKRDIDRLIEQDPRNEEAHMILGTYYYFAGVLPSTLKLAGLVLGIPKGDRPRGLEYLQYAADHEGLARYDALGILGAALFGFEGRFEDAVAVFDTLDASFPGNARLIEPLAVIDLFIPSRLGRDLPRFTRAIEAGDASHDASVQNAAARMRFYRAVSAILTGRLPEARADLELLLGKPPDQPDWLETDINLYLAEVYQMQGKKDLARGLYDDANGKSETRRRLRLLTRSQRSDREESALTLRLQPVARALAEGRLDEAERDLKAITSGNALYLDYCRGELELLRGRPAPAAKHFERLVKRAGRWRLLPCVARMRLSEIYLRQGHEDRAGEVLDEAVESTDVKDLIRHVTGARARFMRRQ